jgi:hypothetical protein
MNPPRVISALIAIVKRHKKITFCTLLQDLLKTPVVPANLVEAVFVSLQILRIQDLPMEDTLIHSSWRSFLKPQSSKC